MAQLPSSAVELGRLFTLMVRRGGFRSRAASALLACASLQMVPPCSPPTADPLCNNPLQQEGVDPENLFTALRAAGGGGDLSQASLSLPPGFSLPANFSLPPGLPGLEGLSLPLGSLPADEHGQPAAQAAGVSAGMEGGASTDEDEDDHGSVGGTQGTGGVHNPPPRTGSINDQKCTKVRGHGGQAWCDALAQQSRLARRVLGKAPHTRTVEGSQGRASRHGLHVLASRIKAMGACR